MPSPVCLSLSFFSLLSHDFVFWNFHNLRYPGWKGGDHYLRIKTPIQFPLTGISVEFVAEGQRCLCYKLNFGTLPPALEHGSQPAVCIDYTRNYKYAITFTKRRTLQGSN